MNVYPFIEAEKAQQHNVARACQLMEVSRSAYYAHRAGPCPRACQDAELTERIIEVHEASGGTYGAPRVHAELSSPSGSIVRLAGTAIAIWESWSEPKRASEVLAELTTQYRGDAATIKVDLERVKDLLLGQDLLVQR